MELYFLDSSFNPIEILDDFSSVVWAEKFYEIGTFTLHFPRSLIPKIKDAAFVRTSYVEGEAKCGRIDYLSSDTDGDCELSGHLLEVLLYDRIITGNGVYSGTVTDAVTDAIRDNLRGCGVTIADDQPEISDEVSLSYDHDNLAKWLYSALKPHGASFRVILDEETGLPVFSLVRGCDRTTDSPEADAAVFSSSFGNIVSIEFEDNRYDSHNVVYVKGSDGTVVCVDKSETGDRHETHCSASEIKPEDFDTESDYKSALRLRGEEILSGCSHGMHVSAECDTNALPEYGTDYFLGDICDVCDNETGLIFSLRLTEVDTVYENGTKTVFPSFGDEVRSIKKLLGDR